MNAVEDDFGGANARTAPLRLCCSAQRRSAKMGKPFMVDWIRRVVCCMMCALDVASRSREREPTKNNQLPSSINSAGGRSDRRHASLPSN